MGQSSGRGGREGPRSSLLQSTTMGDQSRRTAVLVVTTAGSFTAPFLTAAVNIALPAIQASFSLTAVALSWVSLVYLLAVAASLVPFAKVADRIGRKRVYAVSWVVVAAGSVAAVLAPTAAVLYVARVVQGLGAGMSFATSPAIVTAVFPPQQRGKALGINVGATYIGLTVGPVLGGFLTETFGWRSFFVFTAVMALVTLVFVVWRLRDLEWREPAGGPFDLAGTVLYVVGLCSLLMGLSLLPQAVGITFVVVGAVGLVAFGWWETRATDPVFAIHLFARNRVFAFSNLAALINYMATFAVSFLLSLYLQYIKALSAEQAGALLIAGTAVQAGFSPFAGRLSDRVEPRLVATFGMGLCVVGLLMLLFVEQTTGVWYVAAVQCVFGLGFAFFSSPNTSTIMGSVERRFLGVASASVAVMRSTGMSLSMGITALVLALTVGRKELLPADYPAFLVSMRISLVIFAVLCGFGVVASLARGSVRNGNGGPTGEA